MSEPAPATNVIMRDTCPFRLGQRVQVKPDHPFAGNFPGVWIIVGIEWAFHVGDGHWVNISVANDEEILNRKASTDGWSPDDLLPV